MSITSDRIKGAALARKFGAPKTARLIETSRDCYRSIFAMAIAEIGTPRLVEALAEAKDAKWTHHALRNIPNLTEAQRTTLCDVVVTTKDADWAYHTLYIWELTAAQRTTLCETIAATKDADRAYHALRCVPNFTEDQRTTLFDVIVTTKDGGLAYRALYIHCLTDTQRSALQKIARAA
jgi:hypothetical protein